MLLISALYVAYTLQPLHPLQARSHPNQTLVPMYDIDLLWHTHMATSGAYAKDCMALLGKLYSHRDDIEGPALGDAFGATKALYEASYGLLYNPPATQAMPLDVPHPVVSVIHACLRALMPVLHPVQVLWQAGMARALFTWAGHSMHAFFSYMHMCTQAHPACSSLPALTVIASRSEPLHAMHSLEGP